MNPGFITVIRYAWLHVCYAFCLETVQTKQEKIEISDESPGASWLGDGHITAIFQLTLWTAGK